MTNIGFVYYTKGDQTGSLDASWCHKKLGSGTGRATGGPQTGYAGEYVIDYFDSNGKFEVRMDLTIAENADVYDVTWKINGITACVGIGKQLANGIAIGWHEVAVVNP